MEKNIKTGVYMIVNRVNGKKYVGSTSSKRGFSRRLAVHLNGLRKGKHHSKYLQRSWEKYGEDSFDFIIIEECDADIAVDIEQYWLNLINPEYNTVMVAHSNRGYKHTLEQRRKNSEANKGKTPWNKGKKTGSFYKDESFEKRKNTLKKNGTHAGRKPVKCELTDVITGNVFTFDTLKQAANFVGLKSISGHFHTKSRLVKRRYKLRKLEN